MSKNSKQIIKKAIENTKQISAEELMENRQKFLILDVREKEEIDIEPGIENSLKIPRGLLEFTLNANSPLIQNNIIDIKKDIVLFCAAGGRSALAAKTLKDMGFKNIYHVEGGFGAMEREGFKIKK